MKPEFQVSSFPPSLSELWRTGKFQDAELSRKMSELTSRLEALHSVLIAFSGGVDSTFLAAIAQEVLGEGAHAITYFFPALPKREQTLAADLAEQIGIDHQIIASDVIDGAIFGDNPPDRCYHCKKSIFSLFRRVADELGVEHLLDGSNVDDVGDYRPGSKAIAELGVVSPLKDAGFTKENIRAASRAMNLPTADMPSYACLATRFPYGAHITKEALEQVEQAEDALHELEFPRGRVRAHGDVARVEVPPEEMEKASAPEMRAALVERIKAAGFGYVALDLQGYRTGSMNESL